MLRRRVSDSDPVRAGPAAAGVNPIPDLSAPTLERQQELRAAAIANRNGGRPPYMGVRIATRGELDWVMSTAERWGGEYDAFYIMYTLTPRGETYATADLRGVNLGKVALGEVWLRAADLRGANMVYAGLRKAHLRDAKLDAAYLGFCDLEGAELDYADLTEAHLRRASLIDAIAKYAALAGAHLHQADLRRADLHGSRMDQATVLSEIILDRGTRLADVIWGEASLTRVQWSSIRRLGDESRIAVVSDDRTKHLEALEMAVRAYRQLALTLQEQGVTDAAAMYGLRGQVMRRRLLWKKRRLGRWLFSWLLALLAGYGYRLWRIIIAYLVVVLVCAVAYFALGWLNYGQPLAPHEALLASVTAFHGRVYSEQFGLQTPQAWVAAGEAIAGLVIEGVFIAMLVQRVFAGR